MKNYEPTALTVNITADLPVVEVMHDGQRVTIIRNQNQQNTIKPDFALTSRECPPFCIQPSQLAPGVTTIAEPEVLAALQKISDGDRCLLVIDSRTKNWVEKGVIPGAVNIPWDALEIDKTEPAARQAILENQLGAKRQGDFWNFDNAKTLVLYCNGPWCGQSSTTINDLLKIGYPPHKLHWYRDGMQVWESLRLTTVKP